MTNTLTMTMAPEAPDGAPDPFPRIDPPNSEPGGPFPPHEPQPQPDPMPDRPPMPQPEPLPQPEPFPQI